MASRSMLAAARFIGDSGTPLLGINLGSLGYLTDIPLSHLETALRRVLAGDCVVVGRARVHCTVWRDGEAIEEALGLNDVVVNMGPLPRSLELELRLESRGDGRVSYRVDDLERRAVESVEDPTIVLAEVTRGVDDSGDDLDAVQTFR